MSRTVKGSKPTGYEYWSARPGNSNGGSPGRYTKKRTAKSERRFKIVEDDFHEQ